MKNSKYFPGLAILLIITVFYSCKKEPVITNEKNKQNVSSVSTKLISARVGQPGIVYIPLNITLKGNSNVYSGVWNKQVDLDQDSIMDFDFKIGLAWSRGADFYQVTDYIVALQNGGGTVSDWTITALSGMPYAWNSRPLALNTMIGPALSTYANTSLPATYAYSRYFGGRNGGLIIGKGDKYVGMSFVTSGQTYYGWIRINITNGGKTFLIKDAAFQNTAGNTIAAGAMQ